MQRVVCNKDSLLKIEYYKKFYYENNFKIIVY